jgi:archaellum biogenesis protein FlaJ (TadC family)
MSEVQPTKEQLENLLKFLMQSVSTFDLKMQWLEKRVSNLEKDYEKMSRKLDDIIDLLKSWGVKI